MTDREKLIELIDYWVECVDLTHWYSEELDESLADHLIEEGVTLPVRCEECKHGDRRFSGLCLNEKCCVKVDGKTYATEIHEGRFCSYGEGRGE